MKKTVATFALSFVWYFSVVSGGGLGTPKIFVPLGPFDTQEQCEKERRWAEEENGKTNGCREVKSCLVHFLPQQDTPPHSQLAQE